ncbi:MAG: ribosome small subunit-dependent GTPase A [Acidobacteria bacterium]|nr:ribosome small subunit-dependent GTPase A [Acidobacteriota bacterium]
MNLQQRARVCASQGERARVMMDGVEWNAAVAGALLYAAESSAELPVTGDWVMVRRVDPELVLIESVAPRRTWISRRAAGNSDVEQMLAANVDLALLVCGLDDDYNLRRLERYLAIVHAGGVEPVVVLNKADLCADVEAVAAEVRRSMRVERVVAVSARSGEGCEAVAALLTEGVTAVLLGSSGAGKSTLVNWLVGAELRETHAVRESDSRGRHTTTDRQLMELPLGAWLIDTPGLREIQLWADRASVAAVFDEIRELGARCRFRDCTHRDEPGCAVRGEVDAGRLESFHKLQREADRLGGALTEKQRWRSIHKSMRQFNKMRGR